MWFISIPGDGEARAPDLTGSGAWGRGHVAGGTSTNRSCAFYFYFAQAAF